MKNNNKGFSYVEMIVVVAIMALMVGMITISIGMVGRNKVNRASEKLESMIDKARVSAMTKGTKKGFLNITVVGNDVYAYAGEQVFTAADVKNKGEKICDKKVCLDFKKSDGGGGFAFEYSTDPSKAGEGASFPAIYSLNFEQVTGGPKDRQMRNVVVRDESDTKSITFNIERLSGRVSR